MINPAQRLSEEEVAELREDKHELNRKARRQTGMKVACRGKLEGLLECETSEGVCPDFKICHGS